MVNKNNQYVLPSIRHCKYNAFYNQNQYPLFSFLFSNMGGVKSAAVGDVCHSGNFSGWEHMVFTASRQPHFLKLLTYTHLMIRQLQQVLYTLYIKRIRCPVGHLILLYNQQLITACRYSGDVARAHGVDDAHAPHNPRASQGEPCERA